MSQPYTDDETDGSDSEYEYEMSSYEFIGGDDDLCAHCGDDYRLPPFDARLGCLGEYPHGLLIKRYTTCYDPDTYKFGDKWNPYFYKHNTCSDCYASEYYMHPTEPPGELIVQSIHQEAVNKISDWFLKIRYDPKYKYCRKRVDALYDEEY